MYCVVRDLTYCYEMVIKIWLCSCGCNKNYENQKIDFLTKAGDNIVRHILCFYVSYFIIGSRI